MESIIASVLGSSVFAGILTYVYKKYKNRFQGCRYETECNDEVCELVLTNRQKKQSLNDDNKNEKDDEELLKIELPVICTNPVLANLLRQELLYFILQPNEKVIKSSKEFRKLLGNENFFNAILDEEEKIDLNLQKICFSKFKLKDKTFAIMNSQPKFNEDIMEDRLILTHIEGAIIRVSSEIYSSIDTKQVMLSYFNFINPTSKKHYNNNTLRLTRSLGPHIDALHI
jgi:hypothetical protein